MESGDASRLLVGYVRKAHGLKGEVVVRLSTNRLERVEPGSVLFANGNELTVKASRPKDKDFLVLFAGVDRRELADELAGVELTADRLDDPDELWVHDLIGCQVVDQNGVDRGEIVSVQANPASDLLELDTDALVPAAFVTSIEGQVVTVDVPEGLFEL